MRTTNSSSPISKILFLPCLALCLAGNAPIQGWQQAFAAHHLDLIIRLPAAKILVVDFKNDNNPYYVISGKSLLKKTISTKDYIFLGYDGEAHRPRPIEATDKYTVAIFKNNRDPALLLSMSEIDIIQLIERNTPGANMLDACWPSKNVQRGLFIGESLSNESAGLIEYFDKKWKSVPCGD